MVDVRGDPAGALELAVARAQVIARESPRGFLNQGELVRELEVDGSPPVRSDSMEPASRVSGPDGRARSLRLLGTGAVGSDDPVDHGPPRDEPPLGNAPDLHVAQE